MDERDREFVEFCQSREPVEGIQESLKPTNSYRRRIKVSEPIRSIAYDDRGM
jgi:hypothetical protein